MTKNYYIIFISLLFILTSCKKQEQKASLPKETITTKTEQIENKIDKKDTLLSEQKNALINQSTVVNTSLDSDSVPSIPATIKAENQSSISFLAAGAITHIYVKAGDEVKLGQLLASLEDKPAAIEVKNAKIEVDKKRLTLEQQEKVVQRMERQYKSGIVNLATLEKEKNTHKLNILELQSAQVTLEGKEYNLRSTKLFAPYAGAISQILKYVGDYVSPGTPTMQITQTKNYKLFAQIPITYFNQLKIGMKFEVTNPITGNKGNATLKRIVPVIDPASRTFDIYADINTFSEKLVPGIFLEIKLTKLKKE